MGEGPPLLWDHQGPCHAAGGLFFLGTTEAPAAWARGPTLLWDHRGPRRMGEGASFALGPPAHGKGGLLRFGTTEAPAV